MRMRYRGLNGVAVIRGVVHYVGSEDFIRELNESNMSVVGDSNVNHAEYGDVAYLVLALQEVEPHKPNGVICGE
jgi:hypothetical protein